MNVSDGKILGMSDDELVALLFVHLKHPAPPVDPGNWPTLQTFIREGYVVEEGGRLVTTAKASDWIEVADEAMVSAMAKWQVSSYEDARPHVVKAGTNKPAFERSE